MRQGTVKILRILLCLILSLTCFTACETKENYLLQFTSPAQGDPIAVIQTDYGVIKARLFPEQAPLAVANFTKHAEAGDYDGIPFHRVIGQFMIQSGDISSTEPYYEDEFSMELWNFRGALSVANIGREDTNSTQFFIVQASAESEMFRQVKEQLAQEEAYPQEVVDKYLEIGGAPWLDGKHTVFGYVYEGMDVVDQISQVETDSNYRPIEEVKIQTITIETYSE